MNKPKQIIQSSLIDIELDVYNELIKQKTEGSSYIKWKEVLGRVDVGMEINNDTTGNCASFAAILPLNKVYDNLITKDYLIVQKSIFRDFLTIFIKSKLVNI